MEEGYHLAYAYEPLELYMVSFLRQNVVLGGLSVHCNRTLLLVVKINV